MVVKKSAKKISAASVKSRSKAPAKPSKPSKPEPSAQPKPAAAPKPMKVDKLFPIVGIGASAGGLEALDLFLRNVPAASGMAFVIVQHLDPTHRGLMAELLQRATPMAVFQVKDGMRVKPDCVYVIPPNKSMSILNGALFLLDLVEPRGLRLPIDYFFRSLADDTQNRSIGVILSGMGSDGTLGLQAIKAKTGAVFVQEPETAKFDGMPRSAIEAGLADVVASADALPGKILGYLRHVPLHRDPKVALEEKAYSGFEKVVLLLRQQTGHDFSNYKKSTVYRRIERRMGIHQIAGIAAYVRFMQNNPGEVELLFKELLISVTSFFRDPQAWEQLQSEVIPALLKGRAPSQPLRVWIPGCASGEEAYSLAIAVREILDSSKATRHQVLRVFATDLDCDAIDRARLGRFPANIAADLSAQRLERHFVESNQGYLVEKTIRDTVIFAAQNLIMDPPFTKLDLVICRNLLIYLSPELQKKLLPLFHYSLNPGGFLFLGSAESVGEYNQLFAPLAGKNRIFRRLETPNPVVTVEFPSSYAPALAEGSAAPKALPATVNLQTAAEKVLLLQFAPAAVLANRQGDIVFINGRTGRYLEPTAGKANWNIFAMAREGLRFELSETFHQALANDQQVVRKNISVGSNGAQQVIDLTVCPLKEPEGLRGLVMIVFAEGAGPIAAKRRSRTQASDLDHATAEARELEAARQELRSVREEMQSSHEELKSANEEMQSSNEELQSTNEELTTSREEMQSMNEELQTLNAELQAKLDDLSRANSDLSNLMECTQIATVFLDIKLRVRMFTAPSNRVFRLILGDLGRPITDISSSLDYPEMADDARRVIRTLVAVEKSARSSEGDWFRVRIMPYRTLDNVIDGTVITFTDISTAVAMEEKLRENNIVLERRVSEQDVRLGKAADALRTEKALRPARGKE